MATSECWGPAHEVGHCNQTRPGLKWLGTTEVTNNIMSEYIQTTIFLQPSRVQTEVLNDPVSKNRYTKAWNSILVGGISHAQEKDVFCKLIPFWQLQLYFGNVLGRTPDQQSDKGGFYPDVYEYYRTHDDLKGAGNQQLEFVFVASQAAKLNLLDFFEKWGFLKPVEVQLDDYGKGELKVTQAESDAIRQRVEALGYPKPTVPLEYVTDNNVEVLKQQQAVVPGTSVRDKDLLTFTNWQHVMVFEVREKDENGKLICVSDGLHKPSAVANMYVKGGWKKQYKVFAVSHDNKRIPVSLTE